MRVRLLTTFAVLAALLALVMPVPAQAATLPPPHGVWVAQAGAAQLTWSWTAVPGATGYRIAVSAHPTMTSPTIRTVTGRVATFTGLEDGTTYYAVVRTVNGDGLGAVSARTLAISTTVPRPVGEQVPDYDSVQWRWNPYVGAAKYLVQQSTSSAFSGNVQSHVVGARTITLGVERDSYGYLRVKPLNSAGKPISQYWSRVAKAYVAYHPV